MSVPTCDARHARELDWMAQAGPAGPLGAERGSSAAGLGTGPCPGDGVQVTRRCSSVGFGACLLQLSSEDTDPFFLAITVFPPHRWPKTFQKKMGPKEVLLPLCDKGVLAATPAAQRDRYRRDKAVKEGLKKGYWRDERDFPVPAAASCLLALWR